MMLVSKCFSIKLKINTLTKCACLAYSGAHFVSKVKFMYKQTIPRRNAISWVLDSIKLDSSTDRHSTFVCVICVYVKFMCVKKGLIPYLFLAGNLNDHKMSTSIPCEELSAISTPPKLANFEGNHQLSLLHCEVNYYLWSTVKVNCAIRRVVVNTKWKRTFYYLLLNHNFKASRNWLARLFFCSYRIQHAQKFWV